MESRKCDIRNKLAKLKEEAELANNLITYLTMNSEKLAYCLVNEADSATFIEVYPDFCCMLDARCQQLLRFNFSVESLVESGTKLATKLAVNEEEHILYRCLDLGFVGSPGTEHGPKPSRLLSQSPSDELSKEKLGLRLDLLPPSTSLRTSEFACQNITQHAAKELQEDIPLPTEKPADEASIIIGGRDTPIVVFNEAPSLPDIAAVNEVNEAFTILPAENTSIPSVFGVEAVVASVPVVQAGLLSAVVHDVEPPSPSTIVPYRGAHLQSIGAHTVERSVDSDCSKLLTDVCVTDNVGSEELGPAVCQSTIGTSETGQLLHNKEIVLCLNDRGNEPSLRIEGDTRVSPEAVSAKPTRTEELQTLPANVPTIQHGVHAEKVLHADLDHKTSTKLLETKETPQLLTEPEPSVQHTVHVGGALRPGLNNKTSTMPKSGSSSLIPPKQTRQHFVDVERASRDQQRFPTKSVGSGHHSLANPKQTPKRNDVAKASPVGQKVKPTKPLEIRDAFVIPESTLQCGDVAHMVYVSGDSPWDFCLRLSTESTVVSDMIGRLHDTHQLVSFASPRFGDYVYASSSKGYHRGKIVTVNRTKFNKDVTILDLDTGIEQTVDVSCVWEPVAEIDEHTFQTIRCVLSGPLKNKERTWSSVYVPLFKEALENCDLTVTVRDRVDNGEIQEVYHVDIFSRPRNGSGEYNKFDIVSQIVIADFRKSKRACSLASSSSSDVTYFTAPEDRSIAASTQSHKRADFRVPTGAVGAVKKNWKSVRQPPCSQGSLEDDFISFSSSRRTCMSPVGSQGNTSIPHDNQQQLSKFKLIENYDTLFTFFQPCIGILAYVSAPYEFYFQIVCETNATIDDFHKNLNDFYDKPSAVVKTKPAARLRFPHLCACHYVGPEYSGWFRAQVLDWRMDQPDVLVQLVDYGDKILTTLDKLRSLHPNFREQPLYAIRCHLACVAPPASYTDWPAESVNLFKAYADTSKSYQIIPAGTDPEAPPASAQPVSANMNHNTSVAVLLIEMYKYPPVTHNDILAEQCFADLVAFSPNRSGSTSPAVIHEEPDSISKVQEWFNSSSSSKASSSRDDSVIKQQIQPKSVKTTNEKKALPKNEKKVLPTTEKKVLPTTEKNAVSLGTVPVCSHYLAQEEQPITEKDLDAWDPMKSDYDNQDYDDENACIAVSGYEATDDARICEFFAKDGHCFKGLKCRKEHVFRNPDGYTTDKEAVSVRPFSTLMVPCEGEVSLEVTFIPRNKPYFYAIIPSDSKIEETLDLLSENINRLSNTRKYKRIQISPASGQIVLSLFNHDQRWYRARVLDTSNDEGIVDVFYVDYGNEDTVPESNIRIIEDRFLHLPFQAIQCYLANVKLNPDKLSMAATAFSTLATDKVLWANVVEWQEAQGILYCELSDETGDDIGLKLIEKGLGTLISESSYIHFDDPTKPMPG